MKVEMIEGDDDFAESLENSASLDVKVQMKSVKMMQKKLRSGKENQPPINGLSKNSKKKQYKQHFSHLHSKNSLSNSKLASL